MKQPFLYTIIAALALLLFPGSEALAQGDAPRFEIGGQFSLLSRNKPSSQDDDFVSGQVTDPGFGARFTYNVTNEIAFEAEGNFFPGRDFNSEGGFFTRPDNDLGVPSGHIYQGQFGVKAGKRFKKIGLFGKVRPGFVRFTQVSQFTGFRIVPLFHPSQGREVQVENAEFRLGKATYFSMDLGGVVEFYPSRRIVTRLDIGDTIIRYGIYREALGAVCPLSSPCPTQVFERPAETRHNLQFSAGIGIRF
ncbi:MAG TPA: outer membrane beta-barrel protein [Pyrinomonadaceae bacterium]